MTSYMLAETREASDAVRALLRNGDRLDAACALLRDAPGPLTTAARGSSDHAVTAFKYVCEIVLGRPVASVGPSVASVYNAPLRLSGGVHLTVSQSGASPDIVALQAAASAGGARTMAVVNVVESPLAAAADLVIPLGAGQERSVAATKSFIASAAAMFAIVAGAAGDDELRAGLASLPDVLDLLETADVSPLADLLAASASCYVAGRGPGYGIALECALKAKETAGIHAEAFSTAELMHGPLQLVQPGFPVIVFVGNDLSRDGTLDAIVRLRGLGGVVLPISTLPLEGGLMVPGTGHAASDALVFVAAWYRAVERAARALGRDPDRPANLRKVTETM